MVLVGQRALMLPATVDRAGWLAGMVAFVNSGVASEPEPVAGHRVFAAVRPRQYGFQIRTAVPLIVDFEKSPSFWFGPAQVR